MAFYVGKQSMQLFILSFGLVEKFVPAGGEGVGEWAKTVVSWCLCSRLINVLLPTTGSRIRITKMSTQATHISKSIYTQIFLTVLYISFTYFFALKLFSYFLQIHYWYFSFYIPFLHMLPVTSIAKSIFLNKCFNISKDQIYRWTIVSQASNIINSSSLICFTPYFQPHFQSVHFPLLHFYLSEYSKPLI